MHFLWPPSKSLAGIKSLDGTAGKIAAKLFTPELKSVLSKTEGCALAVTESRIASSKTADYTHYYNALLVAPAVPAASTLLSNYVQLLNKMLTSNNLINKVLNSLVIGAEEIDIVILRYDSKQGRDLCNKA